MQPLINVKMNRIKCTFLTLTLCGFFLLHTKNAVAEGYQINAQSTKQLGMGHTGVALKLGAEGMLFNPASMAFMERTLDISLGLTGIKSEVRYSNGDYAAKTDNPLGTPVYGYVSYRPAKNLAVGISVTNPAGSTVRWPHNWAGSALIEEISLTGYCVQPTVSYKFGDAVSIGAGLTVNWGNFFLNRALIPAGGLDRIGALVPQLAPLIATFSGDAPLMAELSGDASASFGINAGVLVNVSESVSIGISFRSGFKYRVDNKNSKAELKYANENVQTVINSVNAAMPGTIVVPPIDEGNFETELPCPYNMNVGVAYRPTENLTLTGEVQLVGWKVYDSLTIQFDQRVLDGYSIKAAKKYRNSAIIRIGGEYDFDKIWALRLGGYYDMTPVRSDYYNPETPGSNKITITAGGSYSPAEWVSVNVAFAYVMGEKKSGSYPVDTDGGLFSGEYKAKAFMPSLGLSFRF